MKIKIIQDGIKILILIVGIITVTYMLINHKNESSLNHIYAVPADSIKDLTNEESLQVYNCFNIVVPDDETNVYIQSFYRTEKEYVSKEYKLYTYVIEIGGVNDYNSFYNANIDRVDENGKYGRALNEFFENGESYYLTYAINYDDYPKDNTDETLAECNQANDLYINLQNNR